MNNVISFSGGKDSTAMLLLMLERGEPIHSVVAFDTGWEFPPMYDHWKLVEQKTGLKITILRPEQPFDYWLFDRPIVARKGEMKGQIHRYGNGWPSFTRRWCTREKVNAIEAHLKNIPDVISCIGIADDERHRLLRKGATKTKYPHRYPLIEYGIDEKKALEICKAAGFHWDGLYDHFNRVSCFCCPLQRIGELRKVRKLYPDLWAKMLEWDSRKPDHNRGFMKYKTVRDMEERFAKEDEQCASLNQS